MIQSSDQSAAVAKDFSQAKRSKKNFWPLLIAAGFLGFLVFLFSEQMFAENADNFLWSCLVVAITLVITTVIVNLYPHLFSVRTFRLPGVFIIAYIITVIIPLPVVYATHSAFASGVRDEFLYGTTVGFLCVIAGVLLFQYSTPVRLRLVERWVQAPPAPMSDTLKSASIILLAFCFAILFMYIRQVGSLPIIQAFTGGFSTLEIAQSREESLKLMEGRIRYVYSSVRDVLFPYTTFLLLSLCMSSRERWPRVMFTLSLLGMAFFSLATAAKSPIVSVLIMLVAARSLLKGQELSLARSIVSGLVIVAAPLLIVSAISGFSSGPERLIGSIVQRIFYGPADVLFYYFAYFPEREGFLLGRTIPVVNKFFVEGVFEITNTIHLFIHPDAVIRSGSANGAYVGFLWADFGWVGIIIGSLMLGMVLQGLQLLMLRLPKSGPSVALQALYVYSVVMLSSTSIFTTVLAFDLLAMVVFTILISRIGGSGRTSAHSKLGVRFDSLNVRSQF